MISLLGEWYGYSFHYCLYRLTPRQALTLIEVKIDRENQVENRSENSEIIDGIDFSNVYDINDQSQLPTVDEIQRIFSMQT